MARELTSADIERIKREVERRGFKFLRQRGPWSCWVEDAQGRITNAYIDAIGQVRVNKERLTKSQATWLMLGIHPAIRHM